MSMKMVEFIVPTVLVVKPHVHPKSSKVYEDEAVTKTDVIDLKANMLSLTMRIDQMEPQMNKMTTMQESIGRIEYSILNFETKLLDSLVEKVSKSLASKGEIPKERVMFPIEISSDECLRKQQSKRNVRDHNSVPVPQNEGVHKKCKNTDKNNLHSICSSSPNAPQLFDCKSGSQRPLNFDYDGRFSGLVYKRNIRRSKVGPFAVHVKLTEEDYDIVRFLFPAYDIHEPEASQLVASTGSHVLTRREVKNCLAPTKYISNDVINYMADVFNETGSGRWYLPTYMADKAKFFMTRVAASPEIDWYSEVAPLCRLNRFEGQLSKCQQGPARVNPKRNIIEVSDNTCSMNSRPMYPRKAKLVSLSHTTAVMRRKPRPRRPR
ncbi:hypothetical protein M0R45_001680 [Rubus argutus]|uniref:Uncharacterized protein n=1 Tax=Rubus argutus TaxID=59490 RepID=A0AAW1VGM1_RUBAR